MWLSNDREDDATTGGCCGVRRRDHGRRPTALERLLRILKHRQIDPCSVRATRAAVEGTTVAVGLEQRGLGPQAYEGGVTIRARGRLVGREDFSLGEGTEAGGVTVALTRFGRRVVGRGEAAWRRRSRFARAAREEVRRSSRVRL